MLAAADVLVTEDVMEVGGSKRTLMGNVKTSVVDTVTDTAQDMVEEAESLLSATDSDEIVEAKSGAIDDSVEVSDSAVNDDAEQDAKTTKKGRCPCSFLDPFTTKLLLMLWIATWTGLVQSSFIAISQSGVHWFWWCMAWLTAFVQMALLLRITYFVQKRMSYLGLEKPEPDDRRVHCVTRCATVIFC